MTFVRQRWSDNDRFFGPFTYARDPKYRPIAFVLTSSGEEDRGTRLRASAFGHTFLISLPAIIRPYRQKITATSWSAADVERMGRDWYWQVEKREFGFSVSEGFLQVFRGRHTMDSSTDRTWSMFLPWTQWRHIRRSYYDLKGEHFFTEPHGLKFLDPAYRAAQETAALCPTATFAFTDFDGELLTAQTRIDESEWRFGEGSFRWLSIFRRSKIRRSLDIRFSGEVGDRKGSWKGGTLGHGIEMLPGELHEAAFRRYCAEHKMKFRRRTLAVAQPEATDNG